MKDFDQYDALGLADLVRRQEVQPIELVDAVIDRIEKVNPRLNCIVIKEYDRARKLAQGPLPDGPFTGVPFLMKDLILFYQGVKTTNACRFFKDFVAPDDSFVVQRFKQAGFILVGKTNTPEFGFNVTTEPVLHGPTRNPWNTDLSPGGSSGGSGAAVAARIVPLADASDGGGSIRIPASRNGLFGLKPSRGRVTLGPHYGDFWYGQAIMNGLALTVRDAAAYLDVVGWPLPGDAYQPAKTVGSFLETVGQDPRRLKIGYTTASPIGAAVHPECLEAVNKAVQLCRDLGHEVMEMKFTFDLNPVMEVFLRIASVLENMTLMMAEMLVGRKPTEQDFEKITWALSQHAKDCTGVQHAMDIEAMRHFSRQIAGDCAPYDVVVTPTMPDPPPPLGYHDQNNLEVEEFIARLNSAVGFTLPFNVSGDPAMSVPLHWTKDGLPVGVQFIARYAREDILFKLAGQLEKAQPWIQRRPPVCA